MRQLCVIVLCLCPGISITDAPHEPGRLEQLVREALPEPSTNATAETVVRKLFAFIAMNPGRAGKLPETETLIALASDGTIVDAIIGTRSEVALSASFDAPLQHAGSRVVLVHNHPSSVGLSGADLGQLGKAGVSAIVAIGHDGSMYAASAGPAFDPVHFESTTYPAVTTAVVQQMLVESPSSRIPMTMFSPYVEHVAALALHKARVIDYHAQLGYARCVAYDRLAVSCGHVAESVGSRVKTSR